MRAVISVIGKDRPGILAFTATECANRNINIEDVTQKVLEDIFTMIMIVTIPEDPQAYHEFVTSLESSGEEQGLKIHVMHEDIFNAMHRI
ncbi:MAG: ACT domain-containing protein [Solobacterium sp.]|nr:ACT domain-containing protein [Solobacterium sp.]